MCRSSPPTASLSPLSSPPASAAARTGPATHLSRLTKSSLLMLNAATLLINSTNLECRKLPRSSSTPVNSSGGVRLLRSPLPARRANDDPAMSPAHSLRSSSNAFLARRRWASMPEEDLSPGMWRDAASPITRRAASSAFLTAPPDTGRCPPAPAPPTLPVPAADSRFSALGQPPLTAASSPHDLKTADQTSSPWLSPEAPTHLTAMLAKGS